MLRFTVAATLLLALCALLLVADLLARTTGNPEPGQVPLSALTAGGGSDQPVDVFFDTAVEELTLASRGAGDDPAEVLPSDLDLQQALTSGDYDSAASQRVLQRLKEGYERYDLPFPGDDLILSAGSPPPPAR